MIKNDKHWFNTLVGCPKCALKYELLLHPLCINNNCPTRVWSKILNNKPLTQEEKELDDLWFKQVEDSGYLDIES